MAAIRMAFKAWLDGEPDELNTEQASEEQMHQYELAEKEHRALVSRFILGTKQNCCDINSYQISIAVSNSRALGLAAFDVAWCWQD